MTVMKIIEYLIICVINFSDGDDGMFQLLGINTMPKVARVSAGIALLV